MTIQLDRTSTNGRAAAGEFYLGTQEHKEKSRVHAPLNFVVASVIGFDLIFVMLVVFSAQSLQLAHESTVQNLFDAAGISALILPLFYAAKLYRIEVIANYPKFCQRFAGLMCVLGLGTAVYYGLHLSTPPHWLKKWPMPLVSVTVLTSILGYRFLWSRAFSFCQLRGYVRYNVVVLGTAELVSRFESRVQNQRLGVHVATVFTHEIVQTEDKITPGSAPTSVTALLRYSRSYPIDAVVIALPLLPAAELKELVRQLKSQPLLIRQMPYVRERHVGRLVIVSPGEVPGTNLLTVSDPPIWGLSLHVKTALDKIVSSLALLLFAPLMLICAIGIKLSSPGPVLFRQQRIGYRNAEFSVYKFRTMHQAADNLGLPTHPDDPRIFEFGRLLRKLRLDELPQLFNVLLGDMSMVGPRPHMSEARAAGIYYHEMVADYAARHRVRPGITGLAQVSCWRGPSETIEQIERRIEHDLQYIGSWTLLLDLKILTKALLLSFLSKKAH